LKIKRILLVSFYCPTRGHAGGLRILDLYSMIKTNCPEVQIDLFTFHRPDVDWSLDDVNKIFDNVYLSTTENLSLKELKKISPNSAKTYDVVDLQFHQSAFYIDEYKTIAKKILFSPMESLSKTFIISLSNWIGSRGGISFKNLLREFKIAVQEIIFCRKVDNVICVSNTDCRFINFFSGGRAIEIETGLSPLEFKDELSSDFLQTPSSERQKIIIYVAYFGSDTNRKALMWYLKLVHSLVVKKIPNYKLLVVGRGDLAEFSEYSGKNIDLIGEVPLLAPYIKSARLGIAPALGGAGFRGKVNQYAIFGIPSVISSIAVQGLAYQDGLSIMIADNPEEFADRCIQLLSNDRLNDSIGENARILCLDRYCWASAWAKVAEAYNLAEGIPCDSR
jgi:glycosyltransferase involved in cell wall biosynthesis